MSYDGALEPLGQSQVLAYLKRLAPFFDVALISFEKSMEGGVKLREELEQLGIEWHPRRYHKRPAVLSTVLDVLAARRALISAAHRRRPDVISVRSYVPALMALLARRSTGGRILFDIRGFWADERVEGGLWPADGLLFRVAKRCERWFFAQSDAIVTQTHASVPRVRELTGEREVPVEVIPNCVDLDRFRERPPRPGEPHAIWSGSVGTWYRFDLVPRLVAALSMPLTVMTRETELANRLLGAQSATVRTVAPDAIAGELFARDIGLCLIASSPSKIASSPTRFGEYLAAGMPVIVTAGVGDLEAIVEEHAVGVVLRGEDDGAIGAAARKAIELSRDPATPERCRRVARECFDADAGAASYAAIYRTLSAR